MDSDRTLGEIAYSAYRESTGGRTHSGGEMPLWPDLPLSIQWAWQAGGCAVAAHVVGEEVADDDRR
ncbi:hypothetical protein DAETH_28650 [Deinococcus aetherius]|uniref:Uncharacterized protein n=1 Tax=Deinococcus aetherius TaxID=200252 RepID=A0ABN6RME1_9DEIO|nr:hypothetical protein [Deinococcus aetherius]BDP42896.1 hypothetical protein DAETH_28650 [Deinococcus aetherius]